MRFSALNQFYIKGDITMKKLTSAILVLTLAFGLFLGILPAAQAEDAAPAELSPPNRWNMCR